MTLSKRNYHNNNWILNHLSQYKILKKNWVEGTVQKFTFTSSADGKFRNRMSSTEVSDPSHLSTSWIPTEDNVRDDLSKFPLISELVSTSDGAISKSWISELFEEGCFLDTLFNLDWLNTFRRIVIGWILILVPGWMKSF